MKDERYVEKKTWRFSFMDKCSERVINSFGIKKNWEVMVITEESFYSLSR